MLCGRNKAFVLTASTSNDNNRTTCETLT